MELRENSPKPPGWAYNFDAAVEKLARTARVSKMRIAQALGFSRHLSLSTISGSDEWYNRLCGAFPAMQVPYVVAGLGLSRNDYHLVEEFFAEAIKALHGYDVDARLARVGMRERADWGVAGVELFSRGLWQEARPYLEHSWRLWQSSINDREGRGIRDQELSVMLWTGTQLVVLDGLAGQLHQSRRLNDLKRAVSLSLRAAPRDRPVLAAAGSALAQIGVGYRLLGSSDSRLVVGYSQRAVDVLAGAGVHLEGQLCGLRDQTKPLIAAMLRETRPLAVSGFMGDAEAAFHKADGLAGGDTPREEVYEPWLLTRATWAECLSVAGRAEEARRLWDSVLTRPWVEPLLERLSHLPIRSKVRMTEMALTAGRGRLDELGRLARAFQEDPANARYGDRRGRASAMERYALTGDVSNFWTAVLH